jgi:NitT/TauT family transport system ATP-binding protein
VILSIKELRFGYGELCLFRDFSLEPGPENPLAILGPSGCGKTSLLRLIAGLERPLAGEIRRAGEISCVFQEDRLLPWMTALENVSLPGRRLLGRAASEERGRLFLERAGLGGRTGAYPGELSGGERRRVAIVRGFACPGPLVLMDEPFQSLDIPLRIALMDLTRNLLALEDRLLIMVPHDPREALYLAERIILLGKAGRGIILDEKPGFPREGRRYASPAAALVEEKLVGALAEAGGTPWGKPP